MAASLPKMFDMGVVAVWLGTNMTFAVGATVTLHHI
jgi:hypothetical protein